jgi:hypothetical protein
MKLNIRVLWNENEFYYIAHIKIYPWFISFKLLDLFIFKY